MAMVTYLGSTISEQLAGRRCHKDYLQKQEGDHGDILQE